MALALQTAPTVEPIALADLKRHLYVDHGEDDDRVSMCGVAARQWVEAFLGRAIVNRTYDLKLRRWPDGRCIRLPYPPLSSVTSITYTGSDGSAFGSTLSSSDYTVETGEEPGRVFLDWDASWPALFGDGEANEVRIRYVAGAAATSALLLSGQRQNWLAALVAVARAFYDDPALFVSEQAYRNEAAEALLWHDRFLGEVDGL